MALPSSGKISFDDVRIEMGQSLFSNYEFSNWVWGYNYNWEQNTYAPINLAGISPGNRPTYGNPIPFQNFSMSFWYNYSHTTYTPFQQTGSLWQHADPAYACYPSTMLIMEAGTTNRNITINLSGSGTYNESIKIYYGKPWNNTGASGTGSSTFIAEKFFSGIPPIINESFEYNYVYNSTSGSYIYFILVNGCP